jgi:hypothetical protein
MHLAYVFWSNLIALPPTGSQVLTVMEPHGVPHGEHQPTPPAVASGHTKTVSRGVSLQLLKQTWTDQTVCWDNFYDMWWMMRRAPMHYVVDGMALTPTDALRDG